MVSFMKLVPQQPSKSTAVLSNGGVLGLDNSQSILKFFLVEN